MTYEDREIQKDIRSYIRVCVFLLAGILGGVLSISFRT